MIHKLLFPFLLLTWISTLGQNHCPVWKWADKLTDKNDPAISSVVSDQSGNFYLSGEINHSITLGSTVINVSQLFMDGIVAKIDTNGNWLWAKKIPKLRIRASSLGPDKELFLIGQLTDTVILGSDTLAPSSTFQPNTALALLDSNGNYKWARMIEGISPRDISSDGSGNAIFLCGDVSTTTIQLDTITLTGSSIIGKIDHQGNWKWGNTPGGQVIATASNGQSWVSGKVTSTTDFDSINVPISSSAILHYLSFIDDQGNWQWVQTDTFQIESSVEYDNNGNCLVATRGHNPITSQKQNYVGKVDQTGTWQWATRGGTADGLASLIQRPNLLAADNAGNGYMFGSFLLGGDVFGSDTLKNQNGAQELYVAKISSSGQWQWAGMAGGPALDAPNDLDVYNSNNILVTGLFNRSCQIGLDTLKQTSTGQSALFFVANISEKLTVNINVSDTTVNCGDSIQLRAVTNSAASLKYNWSPHVGISDTSVFDPIFFTSATTTYTVIGTRPGGCGDTTHITVTVDPYSLADPNMNFTSSTGEFNFCDNGYTVTAPAKYQSYQWSTGDTSQTISPVGPGTYHVVAKNAQGCLEEDSIIISPLGPVLSSAAHFYLCPNRPNDSLQLSVNANVDSVRWSTGARTSAIWVKGPGTFRATSFKGGCQFTDTVEVQVLADTITADFTYQINGRIVSFKATSTKVASYQWYFGDSWNDIIPNPTHEYYQNKKYTACLEIIDLCGRKDTVCKEIDLTGIGLSEIQMTTTIAVFPNPAKSVLYVENLEKLKVIPEYAMIMDNSGRILQQTRINSKNSLKLNIEQLALGSYFLNIGNQSVRFVKM